MFPIDSILFWKIVKFGIVGSSGIVIDFGITYLLKEKLKVHRYLSNSLGFLFAASNNFIWNKLWTFENQNPAIGSQYLKFLLIGSVGLVLNNIFVYLFTEKLKLNFYLSKVFAIGLVLIWNFTGNLIFTFSD